MGLKIWLDNAKEPPKGWRSLASLEEFEEILNDPDANVRQISLSAKFGGDGRSAARLIEEAAEEGRIGQSVLAIHEYHGDPNVNNAIKKHFHAATFAWESLEAE
jgi:hypothetical protein